MIENYPKVTIGLTYYDNYAMFAKVREYYSAIPTDRVAYVVVDDGSPTRPLEAEDMPSGWELLRITEDVGWNNEGARNLIMREAPTNWVALLDLDHVLMPQVVMQLANVTEKLNPEQVPFVERQINIEPDGRVKSFLHKSASPNSFLIHKNTFWKHNGYDESLQGLYGYDSTLVKRLSPDGTAATRLLIGLQAFHLGGGASSWTRAEKDESHQKCRVAKANLSSMKADPQRIKFPWTRIV